MRVNWPSALILALLAAAAWTTAGQRQETAPSLPTESGGGGLFSRLLAPLRSLLDGSPADWRAVQREAFSVFARLYNKSYPAGEWPRRLGLFLERRRQIEASARAYAAGQLPFMMRENAFADWDERELRGLAGVAPPRSAAELLPEELAAGEASEARTRFRRSSPLAGSEGAANFTTEDPLEASLMVLATLPASKDWRATGCVSAPVNQMKCGACYAIATMSVVESMRCLNADTAPILSAQQIVDCATARAGYQNFGCNGGWPTRALRYLQDEGEAARDACYPFLWRQQASCKLDQLRLKSPRCLVNASPTNTRLSYKVLNNERDILYHVAQTGPVVTVMRATQRFLYYGAGIFDDPTCSRRRDDVDHAIVIVGYGREAGQDYWLIKNSWGAREWGQMGYGKYKRGSNACSIGHWGWVVTS